MTTKMNFVVLTTVLFFGTVQYGEAEQSNMAWLYPLAANFSMEDMNKYITAMGYAPERALKIYGVEKSPLLEVYNADKDWRIGLVSKDPKTDVVYKWRYAFQSAKEFRAKFLDDRMIKAYCDVEHVEDPHFIKCVFQMEGFNATSDYIWNGNNVTLTMKAKDASVELRFLRHVI